MGPLSIEKYLVSVDMKPIFRLVLTSFCISAHTLNIEQGRRTGHTLEQRVCQCDNISIEDEFHFLLVCPRYNDLRTEFIPPRYHTVPNIHKFIHLLQSDKDIIIRNTSKFLFYAFKRRNEFTLISILICLCLYFPFVSVSLICKLFSPEFS